MPQIIKVIAFRLGQIQREIGIGIPYADVAQPIVKALSYRGFNPEGIDMVMIRSMKQAIRLIVGPIDDVLSPAVIDIAFDGETSVLAIRPCIVAA